MQYYGSYDTAMALVPRRDAESSAVPDWACSLFAALGDSNARQYGRNFDWQFSPALLLFTDPPDAYASVSMVDVAYLFEDDQVGRLDELSTVERVPLLESPAWPFDGMNENGLVVGMAAVPESEMPNEVNKTTISSLGVIREMLDHAVDVDQAVDILASHNIDWAGGPALHYLLADRTGQSVLVEFDAGRMVVLESEDLWHAATNHLRIRLGPDAPAPCARYRTIESTLQSSDGQLDASQAMKLLDQVAQPSTQWSVVYGLDSGNIIVAMGGGFADSHDFALDMRE
jgi:hypothetical protein